MPRSYKFKPSRVLETETEEAGFIDDEKQGDALYRGTSRPGAIREVHLAAFSDTLAAEARAARMPELIRCAGLGLPLFEGESDA